MPTQELAVAQHLSVARFFVVSLLLGILTVAVVVPVGVAAGAVGWLAVLVWGGKQVEAIAPALGEREAVAALLIATCLVAGVGIANWVGSGPTTVVSGPRPDVPAVTRVLRPWWTVGALLLVNELIASLASRLVGAFLSAVSLLAFSIWLGATATWGAVVLFRAVARVGWRLGTRSMAGTIALGGLAFAAVSLWVGAAGFSAATLSSPEVQRQLQMASVVGLPSGQLDPDCLENLTPQLRRDAESVARLDGIPWADAEDLVSDLALDVCMHHPSEFRAYFLRSVHNAASDWWKDQPKHCPLPEEPMPSCDADQESLLISAEQDEIVRRMRCQLPEGEQQVIALRVHDQLDYREIARRLGVTEPHARQLFKRAKDHLAEKVREVCHE